MVIRGNTTSESSILTHNFEDVVKLRYAGVVYRVQSGLVVVRDFQLDESRKIVGDAECRYAVEHLCAVKT